HCSPYTNFKRFWIHGVEGVCRGHFGDLPSYGRFFGLKLHVVVNSKGQFMAMRTTPGNTDDRTQVEALTQGLKGRIFGDKGCISRKLFQELCKRGLKLVTSIRRNMINRLMPVEDKLHLRQRRVIETMFGCLKEGMRLEHSRRRSATNALLHIVSCLAACILNRKPVGMRGLSQTVLGLHL
ncbi:MAG: transposase, partial [Rhodobacteraceae bacterium]|nr:transposase [Paracoccaceae bacterium]